MMTVTPLWKHVSVQNGYAFSTDEFQPSGDIPLVRIRDILGDTFETYISREAVPSENFIIRDGDLVIGMDGDFNSRIWDRGEAALNQRVCIVRADDETDIRFVNYAMTDKLKLVNHLRYSTTVKHLSQDDIYSMRLPLPPLCTQQRLADYLDRETAEIDAAVADLDRYIKLLDKRKWEKLETLLENSPHDKIRLSVAAKMTTGTTPSRLRPSEEGILWLKPDGLSPQSTGARIATDVVLNNLVSPAGTTYVCGIGATVGKVGYCEEKATTNQQITALVPSIDVLPKLFYYSVSSLTDWFRGTAPGSTLPILNNVRLGTYSVRIPHLAVQHEVLDAVDSLFNKTNRLAMESKTLRDLLLKRRSVLITEVVTGRKQV